MKSLTVALTCLVLFMSSCKKYLDVKSNKSLAVPSTISDAQALLDGFGLVNGFYSAAPSLSDDDYYLTDNYFKTMRDEDKNIYTWSEDVYNESGWRTIYQIVYYSNVANEALKKVTVTPYNIRDYNMAKGQALFFRAFAFYDLAQQWAPPYNKATAKTELGIPLRVKPDPGVVSKRATVEETYQKIIDDLKDAVQLLPATVSISSRPSKAAAYGALARVYLSMREYGFAGKYADSSIKLYNHLINYNTLNPSSLSPFDRFNSEVLIQTQFLGTGALSTNNWRVDSLLYKQYDANDLRKTLFFTSNGVESYGFKGSYTGETSSAHFNGIATDEMYLIRAETRARAGDKNGALADLNSLLITRYKTGTFVPLTAVDAKEALIKILMERRKELVGRGIRWSDLRRLNMEPEFEKTLIRKVNGVVYQLPPNDNRYTFYIPTIVIDYTDMPQNKR